MPSQLEPDILRRLAICLKDSLNGRDAQAQQTAETELMRAREVVPALEQYLVCLFTSPQPPPGVELTPDNYCTARYAAAVMLKNCIADHYDRFPDESKNLVRSTVLNALCDPIPPIRNLAGNVITQVVQRDGIPSWLDVIVQLTSSISIEKPVVAPEIQKAVVGALLKICVDNRRSLLGAYDDTAPVNAIFPGLLTCIHINQHDKVRADALEAISVFLTKPTPSTVRRELNGLLDQLFRLASQRSGIVQLQVCRALALICEINPGVIASRMEQLVPCMVKLQSCTLDDPEVALEATELWLCISEHTQLRRSLGPYLSKIVPLLLENMVYSEEDRIRLEDEKEDAEQQDREQDIKPFFATSKANHSSAANGVAHGPDRSMAPMSSNRDGSGDDDHMDDGEEMYGDADDGDADPEDQWNLRKCSAATLDVLASTFPGEVFQHTRPCLHDGLQHPDWAIREAAVLALGAIADGCMSVIEPHLPKAIPHLIKMLEDKVPVVRQLSCWTLGRYSVWAVRIPRCSGEESIFEQMMGGILRRMVDPVKRVQEAAASAFANLENNAGTQLIPYCTEIVAQFVACFRLYKKRCMYILYDCVQTLAEHVGSALQGAGLVDHLMDALTERLRRLEEDSKETVPFLQCLSNVIPALGHGFANYATLIFERCIRILQQNADAQNGNVNETEADFLVTSLDVLSPILQTLDKDESARLVAHSDHSAKLNSRPTMFELVAYCMKHWDSDVRQSAYALLGDCAIYLFPQLHPHLPSILEALVRQLDVASTGDLGDHDEDPAVSNACWAVGEIAMRQGQVASPYIQELLQRLVKILVGTEPSAVTLRENAAIALGRLAIHNAALFVGNANAFAPSFLDVMRRVAWTDEKCNALDGFIKIILLEPADMAPYSQRFVEVMQAAPDEFVYAPSTRELYMQYQKAFQVLQSLGPNFETYAR